MTRVHRHTVPVDGAVHEVVLAGPILHVGCKGSPHVVDVWAQEDGLAQTAHLLVVGTGQIWPDGAFHLGTAIVPGGHLVWHLLGVPRG